MDIQQLLATMRAAGVARFTLHPDGQVASVDFAPAPSAERQPRQVEDEQTEVEKLLFAHEDA